MKANIPEKDANIGDGDMNITITLFSTSSLSSSSLLTTLTL
jgi:hypothetical protein